MSGRWMMKDVKCKCAHLKSEHHKTFWNISYCKMCHCEEYLKHDRPGLVDKALAIVGVGAIIIMFTPVVLLGLFMNEIPEDYLNEPVLETTNGDLLMFAFVVFFLIGIIIFQIAHHNIITDYFKSKKRRNFNDETV